MIIEHMRKASLELARHMAKFNYDQKPLSMDFINGYFYHNRLYYVFRVNLREYLPDFLGIVGGYTSFDPAQNATILNAQFAFDLELAHPIIRVLNCHLDGVKDAATMFYHPTQKLEIEGPDNHQLITNYHFEPSLSLDIETNSPSSDYAFKSHILEYKNIDDAPSYEDLTKLNLAKFSFTHVSLKTSSFSVEDFLDCFEALWSERLRPDNYNIARRSKNTTTLPLSLPNKKQNKHFSFHMDSGLVLNISINQSAKFIKEHARWYKPSIIEPNLKEIASKTHKTLQVSCSSKNGTLIEATRFLVKAVTACCDLFNAQAVITDRFVFSAKLYKQAALVSLQSSIDYFSWFPVFNIVGHKITLLQNHTRFCAVTEGMERYNLLEIFIPENRLNAKDLNNLIITLSRAAFEKKGNIANKSFYLESLDCTVETSVKRSTRTNKRYLLAKVVPKEGEEEPESFKINLNKTPKRRRSRRP